MTTKYKAGPKYYEMHITLDPKWAGPAEIVAGELKFKTSKIAGDQVMGDKTFMYLTGKDVRLGSMRKRMEKACARLEGWQIPVLRRKIEKIILDERPKI
jgi:hypothetical protein